MKKTILISILAPIVCLFMLSMMISDSEPVKKLTIDEVMWIYKKGYNAGAHGIVTTNDYFEYRVVAKKDSIEAREFFEKTIMK